MPATEYADLTIDPAREADFLAAVARAVDLFRKAEGCRGMRLDRIVERPGTFRLIVEWDSVAHHMDGFRNSPGFQDWRALVGGFFAGGPVVVHTEPAVTGF